MPRPMLLDANLLRHCEIEGPDGLTINGLTTNSQDVKPGMLFAAIKGVSRDGADFIADAVNKGAVAVLAREGVILPDSLAYLKAKNDRRSLALLAGAFYAPQPENVVAVTGTDGKTSTAEFFRLMMETLGQKAASIGTLGLSSNTVKLDVPAINTTPDPLLLQRTLQQLAQAGCRHVSMEASSHGIHQHRLDGVKLQAAAFTNIARDHLDYHGTEQAYFEAKAMLFSHLLPEGKTAVIYRDDKRYAELEAICKTRRQPIIAFGSDSDLAVITQVLHPGGMDVDLRIHGTTTSMTLPLIGSFQILNVLAAMGLAMGCGEQAETLLALLPKLRSVRGRMEPVSDDAERAVFVDYAHTPGALEKALKSLRQHQPKRLLVVFGCGGDRDAGKRPLMGGVASEFADQVFVTDDNPRSEDPAKIRKQVLEGCKQGNAQEIAGRDKAIAAALSEMRPGDILLVAGKGHETTQTIGQTTIEFNDAEVIRGLMNRKEAKHA